MADLNYKTLNLNISKMKSIRSAALEIAESKIQDSKKELLDTFSSHEVTKEIDGGANSGNISGTLGGYGNLFSFIGFPDGFDPISPVKNLINKIRIFKKPYVRQENNGSLISFNINAPLLSDFENETPMPWARGRSWLIGIERGISGLGYFISRSGDGRSGGGQQANKKIKQLSFKNVSYFSKMYSDFFKKLARTR
jgi:hypothetical protein